MCAVFFKEGPLFRIERWARLRESDRARRDGSLGGAVPGTSCQATIAQSLRDKSHSLVEGHRIKLALMGLNGLIVPPSGLILGRISDRWLEQGLIVVFKNA